MFHLIILLIYHRLELTDEVCCHPATVVNQQTVIDIIRIEDVVVWGDDGFGQLENHLVLLRSPMQAKREEQDALPVVVVKPLDHVTEMLGRHLALVHVAVHLSP